MPARSATSTRNSFNAPQYTDPSLRAAFNIIGIENRYLSTRSTSRQTTYEIDIAVHAAELALVLDHLDLPAVHVFAPQSQACTMSDVLKPLSVELKP
jgi:hypothetical protein